MLSVRLRALATHALPSHFFCVVAGLGIGIGLGAVAGRWQAATPALPVVHAMTAQANETFAVCTTPLTTGLGEEPRAFSFSTFSRAISREACSIRRPEPLALSIGITC